MAPRRQAVGALSRMRWRMPRRVVRLTSFALLLFTAVVRPASAQEFVRQSLLIPPFRVDSAANVSRVARQVAEVTRARVTQRADPRAVKVLEGYRLDNLLLELNYKPQVALGEAELRFFGQQLRADEVLLARVSQRDGMITLTPRLTVLRSWGMQQPLPTVQGATAALVGDALAREIISARGQFTGLRRCENAMAKGDRATAAREAEAAIRSYPQAVIARDCLLAALINGTTAADSVRRVADDVLAIDSTNLFAAVMRADALEAERRPADAGAQWRRVYAMRSDSLALGIRIVEALLRVQRPADALANATDLQTRLGANATLRRLAFRAHATLAHWKDVAVLGDSLEHEDEVFRTDANYAARFIEGLRQTNDTLGALEISVRAVRRHPTDSRVYVQYLQLLGVETLHALPRGLTTFPDVPELYVMAASAARQAGKRADALRATREAIRRDSSLTAQYLTLADLFVEEHQPDSAAATLARAPRRGEQSELLRTYSIARGLLLLRGAGDSLPTQQHAAIAMLTLADSIESRPDSRAYVAAATLQLARSQLLQASKTRLCADSRLASETLAVSASAIDRGLGDSANATEITTMFGAMRSAVDNATGVLCKN
ncbi:MAG: hypothetical protein RL409_2036 [Gemmatimonadota bacterium]